MSAFTGLGGSYRIREIDPGPTHLFVNAAAPLFHLGGVITSPFRACESSSPGYGLPEDAAAGTDPHRKPR